ncbi:YbaN family protein [Sphingomonas sp. 1P06PA]
MMTTAELHRRLWFAGGASAMAIGTVGIFLPLLPTVPFYILAAFCFGKSNPEFERRLLAHPTFGPHIHAWRENGAISRRGKAAAAIGLSGSAAGGLYFLPEPWRWVPLGIAIVCSLWILSRPHR